MTRLPFPNNVIISDYICTTIPDFCQFNMIANGDKCYDLELNTANVYDWTESKSRCDEFGIKLGRIV